MLFQQIAEYPEVIIAKVHTMSLISGRLTYQEQYHIIFDETYCCSNT